LEELCHQFRTSSVARITILGEKIYCLPYI